MDKIIGMKAFVAAAESGSFTAAADRLYISKKLVSKYVGQLEDDLGVRLFHRTTRKLSLSGAGRAYYPDCLRILEEIETSEQSLRQNETGLSGMIRMTAPLGYGVLRLLDLLSAFQTEHPGISFDLNFSDAFTNIAQEGYDLAIRIGVLEDSSLIARRLTHTDFWIVGAPRYLAGAPPLARAADLENHVCITDTNFRDGGNWLLCEGDTAVSHKPQGPFRVNNADAASRLAQGGLGLAMLPDYLAADPVKAGRLVRVLVEVQTPRAEVNAVFLDRRHLPKRVATLIDFLRTGLSTN